jgi:hypothetical protein
MTILIQQKQPIMMIMTRNMPWNALTSLYIDLFILSSFYYIFLLAKFMTET